MTLIGTCRNELKDLCWRKPAMKRGLSNLELTLKQSKKIKVVLKSIKAQRTMIATLENAMEDLRKKLATLTKSTGEMDNDGNNSSSDKDNDSIGSEDVDGDADDLSEEEG